MHSVDGGLASHKSPSDDEHKEHEEGKPGGENLTLRVSLRGRSQGLALFRVAPDPLRSPDPEKNRCGEKGDRARDDVDQAHIDVVPPHELGDRERNAADEDGREHLEGLLPGHHGSHEPERDNERHNGEDPRVHRAQVVDRQICRHLCESDQGRADRAPGHRGGVRDEAEDGGRKRAETEADEERGRDRDGCPEARRAFQDRAERKRDQEDLEPSVGREARDRGLHDLELPRVDGDLVEEHRREDDPADGK